MSTATRNPGMTVTPVRETCICLSCETEIGQENIVDKLVPQSSSYISIPKRRITAWCPHCKVLYKLDRVLSAGNWTAAGEVEVIKDREAIAGFQARLDHLKGVKQIAEKKAG